MKTIVGFDLIKLKEDSFCVDLTDVYIKGRVNLNMLNDLLTNNESYLKYIRKDLELGEIKKTVIEVWEDTDDHQTWLDFRTLPDDFEVK